MWTTQTPEEKAAMFARISSSRPNAPLSDFAGGELPHTILSSCDYSLLRLIPLSAISALSATCTESRNAIKRFGLKYPKTYKIEIVQGYVIRDYYSYNRDCVSPSTPQIEAAKAYLVKNEINIDDSSLPENIMFQRLLLNIDYSSYNFWNDLTRLDLFNSGKFCGLFAHLLVKQHIK